ncbi:26S proteasome non-ATPase regulatory subunit 9 [Arctopsyche grandis]|uniref:26S proteasome non-ATPase regulatory subunit 9 n=1 Tax=Arctopsyche grandis TaxID=121162 RepID=UPI00406D6E25
MVVQTMSGPGRDHLLELMKRKDDLEEEIARLSAVLDTNGVGLFDSLVDEEDFPRNDIDVYQVRNARHQIICLRNDHEAIMYEIEKGLYELHSQMRGSTENTPADDVPSTSNGSTTTTAPVNLINGHESDEAAACAISAINIVNQLKTIVKVNFVSPGSPAEDAGIKVDDEIIEFGSVNASNFKALTQIAEVVQHSVNSRVNVKLLRDSETIDVSLTPHTWSGRGLLGCNIIPIDA